MLLRPPMPSSRGRKSASLLVMRTTKKWWMQVCGTATSVSRFLACSKRSLTRLLFLETRRINADSSQMRQTSHTILWKSATSLCNSVPLQMQRRHANPKQHLLFLLHTCRHLALPASAYCQKNFHGATLISTVSSSKFVLGQSS